MMTTYNVRKLNAGDLFKMANILGKVIGDVRGNIGDTTLEEVDTQRIGFLLIESGMKHAETEVKGFLADLVGMTPKEFDKEPFEAPLIIIEKLQEQEDLQDFFTKARNLMNKMNINIST